MTPPLRKFSSWHASESKANSEADLCRDLDAKQVHVSPQALGKWRVDCLLPPDVIVELLSESQARVVLMEDE